VWLDINGAGVGTELMATYGHTVLAVQFSSLLAIVVTNPGGFTASIMRSKLLGIFGILAYGIYLLHYPVLLFVHRFWFHQNPSIQNSVSVLATAIAFVLVILLSWLSWRFFEKPLIGMGHRHKY